MACQISSFPIIDQYLQISQSYQELYADNFRSTVYAPSNSMCIKSEDPFLVTENYDKTLMPMLPFNYQNVDTVPDSNSNYLTEHSSELLDLDDIKQDILHEIMPTSNQLDEYNTDPRYWSEPEVKKWVLSKLNNYGIHLDAICWNMLNGLELCSCSKDELLHYLRNPSAAKIIYSELKKLKNEFQILDCSAGFDYNSFPQQNNLLVPVDKTENFYAINDYLKRTSPPEDQYSIKFNSDSNDSLSSASLSPPPETDNKVIYDHPEPKTIRHKQNIHLWQFLKELLGEAEKHNNCIRWLSNKDGIFKIEDSAHVAKLWGMRKNRPAMNYDKLSRSLRQYYKKGIIKKTLASKRLVYQFGSCYL